MSTYNIQFHDIIRKKSVNVCFHKLSEEFRRDSKTEFELVMIRKRAISVRAIKV